MYSRDNQVQDTKNYQIYNRHKHRHMHRRFQQLLLQLLVIFGQEHTHKITSIDVDIGTCMSQMLTVYQVRDTHKTELTSSSACANFSWC